MNIRSFEIKDTDAVEQLWKEIFPKSAPYNAPRKVVRDKMSVQKDLFFVAEEDGLIIGTVMSGYDGHRGWLYTVAVKPEYRRKGIGRRLVDHAVTALANIGCPKVNLQIFPTNAEVVAFYKAAGFMVEDRISMGKRLAGGTALQE
ncbi:MAG: GNAT family acetyltransferase [Spirochaetales bacterium]|nr:GNAT family acetyltransferase [Spirochaetales bacterium]